MKKSILLGLALSLVAGSVFAANTASLQISPVGLATIFFVTQGASNVTMRTFQAKSIGADVKITSLTVNRFGSSLDSDLSAVKLYLNIGNNQILLGTCTLMNSTCTYNNLNIVVPSGTVVPGIPQKLVLKADVSTNAGHHKIVILKVTSMNARNMQTSDNVQASGLPISSSTLLIQ